MKGVFHSKIFTASMMLTRAKKCILFCFRNYVEKTSVLILAIERSILKKLKRNQIKVLR